MFLSSFGGQLCPEKTNGRTATRETREAATMGMTPQTDPTLKTLDGFLNPSKREEPAPPIELPW